MTTGTQILLADHITRDDLNYHESKRIAQILDKHYPNLMWHINVDSRPSVGMIQFLCLNYSGKIGVNLPINDVTPDPQSFDKQIMRLGGELLERFGHFDAR